jgi:hypothetical protein
MRSGARILLLASLALPSLGFFGRCGGFEEPNPEGCADPDAVVLTSLALHDMAGPIEDGATLPIVYGPQGGSMLSFRLAYEGSPVPDCFAQETRITFADGYEVREMRALRAFAEGETEAMWFIEDFRPGQEVAIRAEAYGLSVERMVRLE